MDQRRERSPGPRVLSRRATRRLTSRRARPRRHPTARRAADDGAEVQEDLDALLADAEAKRDEYLELARRAQADFENYRKRMAAEVQAAALRGKAGVARDVVPVLDDLERALQAAGLDPEGDSEDGLAHGVLLVFRGLRETLKRAGRRGGRPEGREVRPEPARGALDDARRGSRAGHRGRGDAEGLPDGRAADPTRAGRGQRVGREEEEDEVADELYKTLGVSKDAVRGRDQEGVPQAGAPVPP